MAMLEQAIEYWRAGGPLLIPIALVCFGIWLYFLKSRSEMLKTLRASEGIEEDVLERMRAGGADGAAEYYGGQSGLLARAVAAALAVPGRRVAAFRECEQGCLRFLRRDLVVLAGLTAAAPLLGLLGTVRGMVATFNGVAAAGQAAEHVAAGISQALITTQVGLVVAIPGVFGIARLQRLLEMIRVRLTACRIHIKLGLDNSGALR